MGKRLVVFVLAASMTLLVAAVSASGDEEPQLPKHAHVLLLNAEFEFGPGGIASLTYDKCVDLANNGRLKLNAHHDHIHFADAGVSAGGEAGHAVFPAAGFPSPFIEWEDCGTLALVHPPND